MAQKKKVRLADIAAKLKISTVTVSKALSNKEGVGDELREEILKIASEMGYKTKKEPSSTTGNIGILIPARFYSPDSSFYWHLFTYLSKALLNHNYYSIMELLSKEDEKNLKLPRMLTDEKIDGLIILGQTDEKYLQTVEKATENFILLDFYTTARDYDSVSNDNYYCSYKLTNYILSQGHKKLQFVGTFGATSSITDRYMGFQRALLENNIKSNFEEIIPDRDKNGQKIPLELPKKNMPSVFVCNCDETAVTLIETLAENGYRVPEDISVTGFDNYIPQGKSSVELTTVYINPDDTAEVAANLILSKINNQPYIKGRHLVSGEIILRDSVRKL